ncbi:MAG TPA: His/Gly/Thr/Pro-type tRNA ligase C-terminal domain-containing protein, partial [Marmoricola sp.]|nr:His/Gly/Thr/Pro-type tRNA ligase C-terminal domain-containing protein [Marmoricola sp.]
LVRGLDYYTRTTFEFVHPGLGAQSGIGGGGRYDGLMSDLGGQDLSGIGFGLGLDRTLLAARAEGLNLAPASRLDCFVVPLGEVGNNAALLATRLRRAGIRTDLAFGGRGLKGAMKAADRSGAPWVLILGGSEIEAGVCQLKSMHSGAQETIPLTEIETVLKEKLA